MQNLPLDHESKVLIILAALLIIGAICFSLRLAKWMHNRIINLPPYTKQDHKREKKVNKFKSKV